MVVIKDMEYNELVPADIVYDYVGNVYLVVYTDDKMFEKNDNRTELGDLCLVRIYTSKAIDKKFNIVSVDLSKNNDFVYLPELKKAANLNELF